MENKYTKIYIELYGRQHCMSIWDLKAPYASIEEVYRDAIKKGVTWEKLLGFKGYKPNVDL